MAGLEEILSGMGYLDDDVQFDIDENLRTVSIPSDGVVAGVVGDKNINRINFRMPRYYNGFDMSAFTTRINYSNANDAMNYYNVTDVTVNNDNIQFTWLVDSDVTACVGDVSFVVRMIKTENGVVTQAFHSTVATVRVVEGLSVDEAIDPDEVEDIMTRLESDLDNYTELKKTEISESIPDDYETLSNDVSNLKNDVLQISNDMKFVLRHINDVFPNMFVSSSNMVSNSNVVM